MGAIHAASVNLLQSIRSGRATGLSSQENDDRATTITTAPGASAEGERAAEVSRTIPQEQSSAGHTVVDRVAEKKPANGGALREETTAAPETSKDAPANTSLGLGAEEGEQSPVAREQGQLHENINAPLDGQVGEVHGGVGQDGETNVDATETGGSSGRKDRDHNESRDGPQTTPGSSVSSKKSISQNRDDKPARPATTTSAPVAATGFTNAKTSRGSCSATRKKPGAATRVTWRGQPMTLARPVVVIVKDSCLGHRRLEWGEIGDRENRRCGEINDMNRRKQDTDSKVLNTAARDSENSDLISDEESDLDLAAQGKRTSSMPFRASTKGRGRGKTRGVTATASGDSRCGEEKCTGDWKGHQDEEEEAAREGNSANDSSMKRHGTLRSPTSRGGQGRLVTAPGSISRPAMFFLPEPYAGPPVAACARAWPPAGTSVMMAVDPTKGCRRRRRHGADSKKSSSCRESYSRLDCRSSKEAFPSEEKEGKGTPLESKGYR